MSARSMDEIRRDIERIEERLSTLESIVIRFLRAIDEVLDGADKHRVGRKLIEEVNDMLTKDEKGERA